MRMKGEEIPVADVCASFQHAVCSVLCENTFKAARANGTDTVVLAGGVAANSCLRAMFEKTAASRKMKFYRPSPVLCTDNGAMIACAAYYAFLNGRVSGDDLNAAASLSLEDI